MIARGVGRARRLLPALAEIKGYSSFLPSDLPLGFRLSIATGADRALGQAHAMLLAERGRTQENMTPQAGRDNWDTIYALKNMAFPAGTREASDPRRKWNL